MTTHLRESVAYGGLTIEFDDRVLRPRLWTQMQAEWAAELLHDTPSGRVLELCCGAGHIGLLTARLSDRELVAVDLDPQACYFTRLNAEGADLAHRVEVREGPLERAVGEDEMFVLVVADPPWVTSADVGVFPDDPRLAIDGGADGLDVARACLDACRGHVLPGGSVLLQLGDADQAARVVQEASSRGWAGGALRTGARGVVQQLQPLT